MTFYIVSVIDYSLLLTYLILQNFYVLGFFSVLFHFPLFLLFLFIFSVNLVLYVWFLYYFYPLITFSCVFFHLFLVNMVLDQETFFVILTIWRWSKSFFFLTLPCLMVIVLNSSLVVLYKVSINFPIIHWVRFIAIYLCTVRKTGRLMFIFGSVLSTWSVNFSLLI